MSRSRVHMLTVAAARVEESYGNAKLVTDLREAAKVEATKRAEGRDHSPEDEKRIGGHRTLMAMVPDTRAKDDLLSAMAQRAYDLMWDGAAMECDALIEFLPSALVQKMFAAWDNDSCSTNQKSDFHRGEFRV